MTAVDITTDTISDLDFDEPRKCEHSGHHGDPHRHADGGEQFVRVVYPCGCSEPLILVLCGAIIAHAFQPGNRLYCGFCRGRRPSNEYWIPLGPANQGGKQ